MYRITSFLILMFTVVGLEAQIANEAVADTKYREDQFNVAVWYNLLQDKPSGVVQSNLSYGVQMAFIRDLPLNYRRNFGFGLGAGISTNSYYSTIVAVDNGNNFITYSIDATDNLKRSKLETYGVEFPLELRWRSSTATEYKFWRVYTGIKASYLFATRSKAVFEESKSVFYNPNVRQWQYGLNLNFGYNTWNLHVYYALSNLLDGNAILEGQPITVKPLRVGLSFYIL
ncbi:porin family protein [Flavobacterium sp. ASW18X]|uniref:porin family protein n=1 Tax=Flavobacterium sp. ASW18X TaxID=2572595 RepID=UPI0010AE140B|nr:porin family protein [Flavobacterium sp. ASW18X]TKD66590.1 PorT family protein [Flavobacterium sp. ASW18X]